MCKNVSRKISNLCDILMSKEYKGNIRCKHVSTAIRNGKVISPITYNYSRSNVFGECKYSMHAEMSSLNAILSLDRSSPRISHKTSMKQLQCILQNKGV